MGYYSTFSYELVEIPIILNPDKIKKLEDYFSNDDNDVYGFYDVKIHYNEEDNSFLDIELDDITSKFYDGEKFAEMLFDSIVSGSILIRFDGEDGDKWAYRISYDKIEDLESMLVTSEEYVIIQRFRNMKKKFKL